MNGEGSSNSFKLSDFKILSKFLLPDGTIGGKKYGKNVVKIQIGENTKHYLYLYTSQTTGGFWRIYIKGFQKLEYNIFNSCKGKYGHYITTTFVHLDLQNYINGIFDTLPYEKGLPSSHEPNVEKAEKQSRDAINFMNDNSYPEQEIKDVLCDAITDYSSLNGISKSSYIISPNLKNFLITSFKGPANPYYNSINSKKPDQKNTYIMTKYEDMVNKITKLWTVDSQTFPMPINRRIDIKSGTLLELDKRIESMKLLLDYISMMIFKNFDLVSTGRMPFNFLNQDYYIDNSLDNFIYYEDFQSKQFPDQIFRLYSVNYKQVGPVNILLIPLFDENPSGINKFGGYEKSIDPGLWIYKIADYLKQYPLALQPLSYGVNIGLTGYPKLPYSSEFSQLINSSGEPVKPSKSNSSKTKVSKSKEKFSKKSKVSGAKVSVSKSSVAKISEQKKSPKTTSKSSSRVSKKSSK